MALIPVIESKFNPNGNSPKEHPAFATHARHCTWTRCSSEIQLRRTSQCSASTKAALSYLNDLGNDFNGNWYLAFAAYNCEEAPFTLQNVVQAVIVFEFTLPRETKYYVPKLIAVAAIVKS